MLLTHKIQLVPNNKQAGYFAQAAGVSRFAYNWALAEWQRQYEAGERPSEISLRKQLNSIKREQFPWMYEVTKSAPQQAIKNLGNYTECQVNPKMGTGISSFCANSGQSTAKMPSIWATAVSNCSLTVLSYKRA
jgi:hypothetical protein